MFPRVAHFHAAVLCKRHFVAQYCHEGRVILRDHKEMILQKCVCSVTAVVSCCQQCEQTSSFLGVFFLEAETRGLYRRNTGPVKVHYCTCKNFTNTPPISEHLSEMNQFSRPLVAGCCNGTSPPSLLVYLFSWLF